MSSPGRRGLHPDPAQPVLAQAGVLGWLRAHQKLHSTDTLATTKDGLQLRVSKGVGFLENQQKVRIDFRPAYACLNPFFAGKGFGRA